MRSDFRRIAPCLDHSQRCGQTLEQICKYLRLQSGAKHGHERSCQIGCGLPTCSGKPSGILSTCQSPSCDECRAVPVLAGFIRFSDTTRTGRTTQLFFTNHLGFASASVAWRPRFWLPFRKRGPPPDARSSTRDTTLESSPDRRQGPIPVNLLADYLADFICIQADDLIELSR